MPSRPPIPDDVAAFIRAVPEIAALLAQVPPDVRPRFEAAIAAAALWLPQPPEELFADMAAAIGRMDPDVQLARIDAFAKKWGRGGPAQ